MAFDSRGANWIQNQEGVKNPYFGSSMLECGSLTAELGASKEQHEGHQHE
jgi:Cu(I)/Ag(I) efflux system membrane fusion protein